MANGCSHEWVFETNIRKVLSSYRSETWAAYHCTHCLQRRYVKVLTEDKYVRAAHYHDGSDQRDTLE